MSRITKVALACCLMGECVLLTCYFSLSLILNQQRRYKAEIHINLVKLRFHCMYHFLAV